MVVSILLPPPTFLPSLRGSAHPIFFSFESTDRRSTRLGALLESTSSSRQRSSGLVQLTLVWRAASQQAAGRPLARLLAQLRRRDLPGARSGPRGGGGGGRRGTAYAMWLWLSKPLWDPIWVGWGIHHFRTYFSGWIGMFTGGRFGFRPVAM